MSEDYRYNSDLYHAMCKQLWSVVSPDGKKSCAELAVDEIDRLRASLATVAKERDEAKCYGKSLSDRHWTCMKCGGSWNCDRDPATSTRGHSEPVHSCPYCCLAIAVGALEKIENRPNHPVRNADFLDGVYQGVIVARTALSAIRSKL